MKIKGWHVLHEAEALTLSRRLPVRFDLAVSAPMGLARKLPLAQQIRQDLWRALQNLRGFSPVVRVAPAGAGLLVTAGGQVEGRFDRAWAEARIADLLTHPAHLRRWARWARCA